MKENVLEIYFIRHADAENGSTTGRDLCDKDITGLGEKQLKLLSERFQGVKVDAILSSPLVRTVKTACAVADVVCGNVPVEIVPELIERGSTPGYIGLPAEELRVYNKSIFACKDRICRLPVSGEPTETKLQCLNRAEAVAGYLKNRFGFGQKIVVVSHGVFGNNFFQAAMGIVNDYDFRFTSDNTAVTKIEFSADGVRRIVFQNDVSHLLSLYDGKRL